MFIELPNQYGDKLRSLQLGKLDIFSPNNDAENNLKMLSEEQNFKFSCRHSTKASISNNHCCIIEMTDLNAKCVGFSTKSFIDAQNDSYKNALEYLRIVTQ